MDLDFSDILFSFCIVPGGKFSSTIFNAKRSTKVC